MGKRMTWIIGIVAVAVATLDIAAFLRYEQLKRDAIARAAAEPWRRRPDWAGTKPHGNAPVIVREAFENDPPAPDGRKNLFAISLDPSARYYVVQWSAKIESVKPTSDGWQADLTVMARLNNGRAFNTAKTAETWHVSKSGEAHCVKCAPGAGPAFVMVD